MVALNRKASERMLGFEAHACTDVTGFGFVGHALGMVAASNVGMRVRGADIPVFPEAMEYARLGLIPGGTHSNRQFFSCRVDMNPNLPQPFMDLLYDPQTSGGLLISVPSEKAEGLVTALREDGVVDASLIGEVVETPKGRLEVV